MRARIPLFTLSLLVTIGGAYPLSAQETCYDTCQDWVCDPQTWVEDTCGGGCSTVCDTCWDEDGNPYDCNCREECQPTYPCNGRWEPDPPNCYWSTPYQCNPHACPPVCGDGICAPGLEDCGTCLADCPCWDPATPVCQANQCVPPVCGDTACSAGEDCSTCAADCGVCPPPPPDPYCGDSTCGATEDCTSCPADCGACPPPPGDVFAYTDETYDGNNFSVHAVAETDYNGGNAVVELETTVTLESNGQTVGSASSAGYPSTAADAGGAVPPPAEMTAFGADPGTVVVIGVVVRLVIGGVISKIKSWFSRTKYGGSILCYKFVQDLGQSCGYALIEGCNVNCAAQMPLYVELKTAVFPVCTPRVEASVLWSRKGTDAPKCGFFTVHTHPPSCACGQS